MTVMLLASEFSNENLPQPPARIAPPKPAQVNRPQPVPLPVEQQLDAASVPVESAAPDVPATPLAQPTEALPKENAVEKIEPDYQASYLNNRLNYPLSARRMGVQGRVILNVEVLAEGIAGQILIQQSSGHEVLDQAALESVKHWRFIAARRGGEPYTRRFTVPIQFSLQGNAK